jgi:hypothetical protein
MNLGKLTMWVGNAFFWGLGIIIASAVVDTISQLSDSYIVRFLIIIILGGIVMHFYNIINNKERYIKDYKDIIKD